MYINLATNDSELGTRFEAKAVLMTIFFQLSVYLAQLVGTLLYIIVWQISSLRYISIENHMADISIDHSQRSIGIAIGFIISMNWNFR